MTDAAIIALMYADIDGELEGEGRAVLARRLLEDPECRALYNELQGLCQRLDALPLAAVPDDLRTTVLAQLPAPPLRARTPRLVPRFSGQRLAAVAAGVGVLVGMAAWLHAGSLGRAGTAEMAGTMLASAPTRTTRLVSAPLPPAVGAGRVALVRTAAGLALALEVDAEHRSFELQVSDAAGPVALGAPIPAAGFPYGVRPLPATVSSAAPFTVSFRSQDQLLGTVVLDGKSGR